MKSALITGVCGGVGSALAKLLKKSNWAVFGTDVQEYRGEFELDGFWQGDISCESFWTDTLVPDLSRQARLNGFVHNAAVQPIGSIVDISIEDWDQTLAINLRAAFLGIRHLLPLMLENESSIVNVSSVHAVATSKGMCAYVASKGGLLAFTRAAALELADRGIRVNAVLPGAVDTPMLRRGFDRTPGKAESAENNLISKTPLKKIAKPGEIAKSILFLLDSDQSSFITGQDLIIDGGAIAHLSTE